MPEIRTLQQNGIRYRFVVAIEAIYANMDIEVGQGRRSSEREGFHGGDELAIWTYAMAIGIIKIYVSPEGRGDR